MRHPLTSLFLMGILIALGGCSKEPKPASTPAAPKTLVANPAVPKITRPAQEIAYIRECLAVGLRPTLIIELESKAMAEAQDHRQPAAPTKAQLDDLHSTFQTSAVKLHQMATSREAGRMAKLAQLLGESRAKQATNCSRLSDEILHMEGLAQMVMEFRRISAQARNEQEADRMAGEHLKQNWQNLLNLPPQQKAALQEILETEQQLQQVVIELNKDAELKSVQKAAIADVIKELETRAQKAAAGLTPERFYETLIGYQFRPNAGRLEAGEMVKLVIKEQKIVGHCIVSVIHLDLRGNRSGQTASLELSVVHKTYADGRPVRLQVTLQ